MQYKHKSRIYLQIQQFQKDLRGNITVGAAGEVSLIGENHDLQINKSTKMRPTTRKYLGAVKRGANYGYG